MRKAVTVISAAIAVLAFANALYIALLPVSDLLRSDVVFYALFSINVGFACFLLPVSIVILGIYLIQWSRNRIDYAPFGLFLAAFFFTLATSILFYRSVLMGYGDVDSLIQMFAILVYGGVMSIVNVEQYLLERTNILTQSHRQ